REAMAAGAIELPGSVAVSHLVFPSPRSRGPRGLQPGRGPVLELHAESQPARGQNFLDLVERFPTQIGRLQKLGLGPLDQVADVIDVFRLEAIRRAYRELEIVHRTQQDRIDLGGL